jgi:hypothetical protein
MLRFLLWRQPTIPNGLRNAISAIIIAQPVFAIVVSAARFSDLCTRFTPGFDGRFDGGIQRVLNSTVTAPAFTRLSVTVATTAALQGAPQGATR